jgi:lincosamide nucleotidyltransferase B/F
MLVTRAHLIARLESIGRALACDPETLALLGLGSCGPEIDRLDDWSDLDFFVIVQPQAKQRFIEDHWWLSTEAEAVFCHRNTHDGCKVLGADGVFCEFAVFAPDELPAIPFSPGRVVWARDGFDTACLQPRRTPEPVDLRWQVDEALGNVLVGLKRLRRGEVLAAWQSVVIHAGEQALRALKGNGVGDRWNPVRRLEADDPALALTTLGFARAPGHTAEAARAIVDALASRFILPAGLVSAIESHLETA